MRLTALLLLGLLAAPAPAQPASGDLAERLVQLSAERAGGDETEPWRYFPLEVGNAWEYTFAFGSTDAYRSDIPKDTLIGGTRYFIRRFFRVDEGGNVLGTISRVPVRFDTLNARIVGYSISSQEEREFPDVPCPFTGGLGDEVECYQGVTGTVTYLTSTGVIEFDPEPVVFDVRIKEYQRGFDTYGYAADFGQIYGDTENDPPYEITFCRVGGVEYGAERFPVASEGGAAPSEATGRLEAYPNPFRDRLTAAFELERTGPVVVEVVDVLGRVVRRRDLGVVPAGRREVVLGGAGLPAGLYVVRLAAGERQAVRRVVRVR